MIWFFAGLALGQQPSGVVTDASGERVPQVQVIAYDQRFNWEWVMTDADGHFAFDDLPANPYRFRLVGPPSDNLVEQWAHDTLMPCEAEVWEGGSLSFSMSEGGVLTGVLPSPGLRVTALPAVPGPNLQARTALTDADGAFTLRGLAPYEGAAGTWAIRVQADGVATQFVGGAFRLQDAATWTVAPGETLELGAKSLLPGAALSGTVRTATGPVAFSTVKAFSEGQLVQVHSGADGTFAIEAIPPGEVLLWAETPGLATTWWPDADRPSERLVLADGERADDLVLTMASGAILEGRLSGPLPVEGVNVLAFNDDRTVAVGDVTNVHGEFRIDGLHPGPYVLYVFGASHGYLDHFVGGEASPTVFEAPEQGALGVGELVLDLGGRLSGTVTNRHTGAPVYGASVEAVGQQTGTSRVAVTDRQGRYDLSGLPPDTWRIWVEYQPWCPSDRSFTSTFHPDQRHETLGGTVRIGTGEEVTWDALVAPDDDQDGMDDVWEGTQGLDPTRDDAAEDADGDGFSNLDEYLLGTDAGHEGSRRGCGGGRSVLFLPILLALRLADRPGHRSRQRSGRAVDAARARPGKTPRRLW